MGTRPDFATDSPQPVRAWIVDPIGYTGMAYYDAGLAVALQAAGIDIWIVSTAPWLLGDMPTNVPRRTVFWHGSSGPAIWARGAGYLASAYRLLRLAGKVRPDLVHWQYLEVPEVDHVVLRALRRSGSRIVVTAHEVEPWSRFPHSRRVLSATYALADAVLVHNQRHVRPLIRRYGIPSSRVHVVEHGDYEMVATPGLPGSQARSVVGLPADRPVALFFGSIRPSKGLEDLLSAWPSILAVAPSALLAVVGKPYRRHAVDRYMTMARDLGVADSVRFHFEQVSPDEANAWYRAANVVVLPYHEITTSGVLRYAYSSGRAVVATSVGEHPDLVQAGHTGLLVPPGDVGALGRAIAQVLVDPGQAEQMGRNALDFSRSRLGWTPIGAYLAGIYRSITAGRS